jgi:hypothetical protein
VTIAIVARGVDGGKALEGQGIGQTAADAGFTKKCCEIEKNLVKPSYSTTYWAIHALCRTRQ